MELIINESVACYLSSTKYDLTGNNITLKVLEDTLVCQEYFFRELKQSYEYERYFKLNLNHYSSEVFLQLDGCFIKRISSQIDIARGTTEYIFEIDYVTATSLEQTSILIEHKSLGEIINDLKQTLQ